MCSAAHVPVPDLFFAKLRVAELQWAVFKFVLGGETFGAGAACLLVEFPSLHYAHFFELRAVR